METALGIDTIRDANYAQALRIAEEANAANSSVASNPGGLEPSVHKVQILELLSTGKKWDPYDYANGVRSLPALLNHFKYGDIQPAIVVGVSPEWVKVAAYSDEFDTIVVLGYPTEAVDLIAPGRRRPTIGMRLIVACQYTGRCNCTTADHVARKGVQDDIMMGPKTYDRWYNFHPLVAQFLTDDSQAPVWEKHIATIGEDLWEKIWADWLSWKDRHGPNYFRLGAISRAHCIATDHLIAPPPSYSA